MTNRFTTYSEAREAAALYLNERAAADRAAILEFSGNVIRLLLKKQNLDRDFATSGEPRKLYVIEEEGCAPTSSVGVGPVCLAAIFKGYNPYREREERIRVCMPSPDGFDKNDMLSIELLDEPEEVYLDRSYTDPETNKQKIVGRHAVMSDRSFPYVLDPSEELDMSPDAMQFMATRLVGTEPDRLSRYLIDMTNWWASGQRATVHGEGDVTNI